MLTKMIGVILLVAGVLVGLSVLVALIGTAIGLVWFLIKVSVPMVLVYLGYRMLCSDRTRYA